MGQNYTSSIDLSWKYTDLHVSLYKRHGGFGVSEYWWTFRDVVVKFQGTEATLNHEFQNNQRERRSRQT